MWWKRWLVFLRWVFLLVLAQGLFTAPVLAHSGGPYPILLNSPAGPYRLTVLADPHVGQGTFVITGTLSDGAPLPATTRVTLDVAPLDGHAPSRSYQAVWAEQTGGAFRTVIPFDRKGSWRVHVRVQGLQGEGRVEQEVTVTPQSSPWWNTLLWLMPFLALGGLWSYAALRSRRTFSDSASPSASNT